MTNENTDTNSCPRTFTDRAGHSKTIYCAKWTCKACATRKLRRLIATTSQTATANAPLYLLTVRAARISVTWNRFTQRIRRPYIGAVEHRPNTHVHAIIQKPPRDAAKIWTALGGTYYHLEPVMEYAQTLEYVTKTLTDEETEARLIKSRDWNVCSLDTAVAQFMDSVKDNQGRTLPPPADNITPQADSRRHEAPAAGGGPPNLDQPAIQRIIELLPEGTHISFTIRKGKTDDSK